VHGSQNLDIPSDLNTVKRVINSHIQAKTTGKMQLKKEKLPHYYVGSEARSV
jgi:hypothetical protein